jgi:quercetin dioxygenase-like cupin family protein
MSAKAITFIATATLATAVLAKSPVHETVRPVYSEAIANIPGKVLNSVIVSYPPGAKSLAHRHAPSAFIYAFVLSGTIRSQVGAEPAKIYRAGESWTEAPGAHHVISENASETQPASLLAIFISDTGDAPLTTPDHKVDRP